MASLGAAIHLSKSKASILGMIGVSSIVAISLASPAKASGFIPSFSFITTPPSSINVDLGVYGYHFETEIDRPIKSIGIYKNSSTDHTVGLWDFSGASPVLLWQQQILSTDPCQQNGLYCWFNVSDKALTANKDYVIAATWGNGDAAPAQVSPSNLTAVPNFKLGNTAASPLNNAPSSYLVDLTGFPPTDYVGGDDKGYYVANLSFTSFTSDPSQVPAPLPLFGAAAAFGMSRKIRRRITAAS
jgi:hypothetical protein